MTRVMITGTAGFIGYHMAGLLLAEGHEVLGFDALTPQFDGGLKAARHGLLARHNGFHAVIARLEDEGAVLSAAADFRPEVIIHLAAQAGVRYSLEHPDIYLTSNVIGTFAVLKAAQTLGVRHLLIASTSSVYGANPQMPFCETDKTDLPLSVYAATKKSCEAVAHSWSHLHDLPVTLFRFFTVYGPWCRPDLALFRFVERIEAGEPIELYNHGEHARDFTYVGDLVRALSLLIDQPPRKDAAPIPGDSLSPVAPWRVVNIGSGRQVTLAAYVAAIETALGKTAQKILLPARPGDVAETWADPSLLRHLIGYVPDTPLDRGVQEFVAWYRDWMRR